jgi:isoquinoline 1-oxidoreductase alpha subunit
MLRMAYRLNINGAVRQVDVPAQMPLLWVLRDELGLVGTKFGCGKGYCGACTVHVNGVAQRSCQLPVGSIGPARIHTIEHIGTTAIGAKLQQAWLQIDVMQCGYCQAGQIMSACALLGQKAQPSAQQIDAAMAGNICRCACYNRIRSAIRIAAGMEEESGRVA